MAGLSRSCLYKGAVSRSVYTFCMTSQKRSEIGYNLIQWAGKYFGLHGVTNRNVYQHPDNSSR